MTYRPQPRLVDLGAPVEDLAAVVRGALEEHGWRYQLARFNVTGPLCVTATNGRRLVFFVLLATADRAGAEVLGWLGALRRVPAVRAEVVRPEDADAAVRLLAPASRGSEQDRDWRPL